MSDATDKRCAEALAEVVAQWAIVRKLWPATARRLDWKVDGGVDEAERSLEEHARRCVAVCPVPEIVHASERRCILDRDHHESDHVRGGGLGLVDPQCKGWR